MIKTTLLLLFLFPITVFAQDLGKIKGLNARYFQLKSEKDSIDFLLINDEIGTKKPVLLFCQGSHPMPLIISNDDGSIFIPALSAFNYNQLARDYHLVIISMPKTPLDVNAKKLNSSNLVVQDTAIPNSWTKAFLDANYFENYVFRAKKVISYLAKQKWVDRKRISILGHSQGAKVAVGAALGNRNVFKVGFFSGNPYGRLDQTFRVLRNSALTGKRPQAEVQNEINRYYKVWDDVVKHPNDRKEEYDFSNRNWISFEKSIMPSLLRLEMPLYVAYGTEDPKAIMCDMIPIEFTAAKKTNLTMKAYVGLEHNFREIDSDGVIHDDKIYWQEVIDEFAKWLKL
jgi:pimeloyl-ACP methyl ester carboxylesterase